MDSDSAILPGVRAMLVDYLQVLPGDRVIVLAEVLTGARTTVTAAQAEQVRRRAQLAAQVADLAARLCPESDVRLVQYPLTARNGSEPPAEVAGALQTARIVIALTTHSLTHTHLMRQARQQGLRGVSMPGVVAEMFAADGPITTARDQIARDAERMAAQLTAAAHVRLHTPEGTDLNLSIAGVAGRWSSGRLDQPGQIDNLPFGEAYLVPVEGSAQGVLIVPAGWHPHLTESLVLHFKSGLVMAVEGGGAEGKRLRHLLDDSPAGRARRNCAELGIGSNPGARRPDIVLEAEKIKGTVHVAIGNSTSMGGSVYADLHQDFVLPRPTLLLDAQPVIIDGVWQV